jgi:hypothetical protein
MLYASFSTSNEEACLNLPARREAKKWIISALLLLKAAYGCDFVVAS